MDPTLIYLCKFFQTTILFLKTLPLWSTQVITRCVTKVTVTMVHNNNTINSIMLYAIHDEINRIHFEHLSIPQRT